MAKQETELETLESDFERQNEEMDARFQDEEIRLRQEFAERKKRLIRRWALAEAIERRKLEQATGETYEPLPPIVWSDDARETREEREKENERERTREGQSAQEVNLAYDALNMI